MHSVESFWESLLSRQPDLVWSAFNSIDKPNQEEVLRHLRQMVDEDGWHPEQVISALTALDILAPD